jgi:hypothetical protein
MCRIFTYMERGFHSVIEIYFVSIEDVSNQLLKMGIPQN